MGRKSQASPATEVASVEPTTTKVAVASATLCINDADRITGVTLSSEAEKQLWAIEGDEVTFEGFDSIKQQFDTQERNGKILFVRAKSIGFVGLIEFLIKRNLLTNPQDWK